MNQFEPVDVAERRQNLLCDDLKARNGKICFLFLLAVVLRVLIKIVSQKFCHYKEMLLMIEEVVQPKQVLSIEIVTVGVYVPQQFYFVYALVKVVFVVFNNFHADHLLRVNVVTLYGLAESC